MDADLARLGAEDKTLHADEVADVEQFLEDHIIEILILIGTQIVASDIYLNTAFGVLDLCKGGLSHDTAAHHTSGDAHLTWFVFVTEIVTDVCREGIGGVFCGGIGVNAHVAQFLQALAPAYFLFT